MEKIIKLNPNIWVTPSILAKRWKVSRQTVNNMINDGRVEFKKIEEWDLTLVKDTRYVEQLSKEWQTKEVTLFPLMPKQATSNRWKRYYYRNKK